MVKDKMKSSPPLGEKEQREQRLASSLRANLHRRKAQSRGRKATGNEKRISRDG